VMNLFRVCMCVCMPDSVATAMLSPVMLHAKNEKNDCHLEQDCSSQTITNALDVELQ